MPVALTPVTETLWLIVTEVEPNAEVPDTPLTLTTAPAATATEPTSPVKNGRALPSPHESVPQVL